MMYTALEMKSNTFIQRTVGSIGFPIISNLSISNMNSVAIVSRLF
jgi:hypothetical protein